MRSLRGIKVVVTDGHFLVPFFVKSLFEQVVPEFEVSRVSPIYPVIAINTLIGL